MSDKFLSYDEHSKVRDFVPSISGLLHSAATKVNEAEEPTFKASDFQAAEDDIVRAISIIMGRFKFFGELVYNLRIAWVKPDHPQIQTMATDGRNVFINPKFVQKLKDRENIFVFCHEIMHNVLGHFARMANRDPQLWNIATDMEINPLLVDEGLLTAQEVMGGNMNGIYPGGANGQAGKYSEKYFGWSAEQIYEDLKEGWDQKKQEVQDLIEQMKKKMEEGGNVGQVMSKEQGQEAGQGSVTVPGMGGKGQPGDGEGEGEGGEGEGSGQGTGSGSGSGSGEEGEGEGEGQGSGGSDGENNQEGKLGQDGGHTGKARKMKGKGPVSEEEMARGWQSKANDAMGKMAGSGMGRALRAKILSLNKPKVDWKKELKRFVGKALSGNVFKMPARRHLYKGTYIRGIRKSYDSIDTIAVCVDTSGSISEGQIMGFLSEVDAILKAKKPQEVDVIYFDHDVQDVRSITSKKGSIKNLLSAAGGGGTAFEPPIEWIEKNLVKKGKQVELVLFFTDGYANLKLKKPTFVDRFIWIIIDDTAMLSGDKADKQAESHSNIKVPWGKRLDIDTKDITG